jgi:hypothetical protein
MRRWFVLSIRLGCLVCLGCLAVTTPAEAQEFTEGRHSVRAGLGLLSYFAGGAAGTSGAWDFRYTYTPWSHFGVEAGYTGAVGDAIRGTMVATILTGNARVNILPRRITPFVTAGLGYGAFSNTGIGRSDNSTLVIPLSGGADFRLTRHISANARFTYNLTLRDAVGPTGTDADNWALIGGVGSSF